MSKSNESMSVKDALEILYYQGLGYLKGICVERDTDEAVRYITASATAGLPEAMKRLSDMYAFGDGVTPNKEISKMWLDRFNKTK